MEMPGPSPAATIGCGTPPQCTGAWSRHSCCPDHPVAIAAAPGVIWVAATQPAMLLGYDPETLQPSVSVNLPRPPVDIATEGDLLLVVVR